MKIRNKILLYFYSTVIALTIIATVVVYVLFAEYREEEFQQRQKEKINFTVGLITEYENLTDDLSKLIDLHLDHEFYDETVLIYDKNKKLIYNNSNFADYPNFEILINQLTINNQWIETRENKFDIIAFFIQNQGEQYYAVSRAYDIYGYKKLYYLRDILLIINLSIAFFVLDIISINIIYRCNSAKLSNCGVHKQVP